MNFLSLALALALIGGDPPTVTHRFQTPGNHDVSLTVCDPFGVCRTLTRQVLVRDPRPAIASLDLPPLISTTATLELAAQTSGRPPLSASWKIVRPGATQNRAGNPVSWRPTAPGDVQVGLTLSNGHGSLTSPPRAISVVPSSFGDVLPTDWFSSAVETLYGLRHVAGCSAAPPRYCPHAALSRAESAVLLHAASGRSTPPFASGIFQDLPATHWAAPFVERLWAEQILTGCSTTPRLFCPAVPATRAQFAVLLVSALAAGPLPSPVGRFSDVPITHWAAPFVEEMARRGITAGCTPTMFCPDGFLTRAQAAVFLTTAFDLSSSPSPTVFSARATGPIPSTVPVTFDHAVAHGRPDVYEYDWQGDGTFEETSTYPVTIRSFAPGTYRPALRLRRGSFLSAPIVHPPITIVAPTLGAPGMVTSISPPTYTGFVYPPNPPGFLPGHSIRITYTSPPQARGILPSYTVNGGPRTYLPLLPTAGPATLLIPPFDAPDLVFLSLQAFNAQGLGPLSMSVQLQFLQ